jgi:phosphohistidine phosphatase
LALDGDKKTLLILRHAKSSWKNNSYLPDHDRPLNKRGQKQAIRMGKLLKELGIIPDYIVTSTAKRSVDTSKLIVEFSGYGGMVDLDSSLYHQASAEQSVKILSNVPDGYIKVLLIGHNPSLECLIDKLTNRTGTMKTCSLAQIDLRIKSWKDIVHEENVIGSLVNIWHPNLNKK